MRFVAKTIVAASVVFAAFFAFTQQSEKSDGRQPDKPGSRVMAKISYDSGITSDGRVRQICFAVDRDGEYRMVRSLIAGNVERLHGTVPKEKLDELDKLISAPAFRKLTNDEPGLIRRDAEAFVAEIPLARVNEDEANELPFRDAWRLRWLNPDGQRPFPEPVSSVVDWVRHFQPKDAQVFDYVESPGYADVCPALGFRLLQPSLAEK
jgi:hypothetical protein